MTSTLVSKIARSLWLSPVYVINHREDVPPLYYGPEFIARIKASRDRSRLDIAPHPGGLCQFLAACDACAASA